jgi:pilus assembly protein CpaF
MGDRMMGRPEYSQVSAILATNELESEFDSEFHEAQHDVATVLFENIAPQDLSLHYPPSPEDHDRFRQVVENAVNTVNPRVDNNELIELITQECIGLGPIDRYLDDPEVHEIYVNRWDFVLVRKDGQLFKAERAFSHPQLLMAAAYRLLGPRGEGVEVYTDEMRFNDGTRVHVILPPLAPEGAAITVRKPPNSHPSLDDLVERGTLSQGMAEFLSRSTEAGRSILIAGPSGSGKSTLLSALTQQMPSGARVVAIEHGAHLALPANSVRLEPNAGAGFDPRFLVHSAMSMHPQRIVLDECRGAEAYDWVTTAACGTEGSMVTLHGTSAAEALGRLESLCLMGASNLSPRGLREQIARAVNLVVVVNRTNDGGFRVQQITEVQGVDLDAFRLNDVFYFRVEGADGGYHPTGYVPLFYEDMRHAGVDVDFGIFRE